MKYIKLILTLIVCFNFVSLVAQINGLLNSTVTNPSDLQSTNRQIYSPEGILDNIFDQFGNKYSLSDVRIQKNLTDSSRYFSKFNSSQAQATTFTTCNSGYFKLYFEVGCGMDGNTITEVNRRNVICQVFSDMAQFISSPLSNNAGYVNIYIRNISNMGVVNPSTNLTLGVGSCFFSIPAVQNIGGIADNLIWQTIVSGTDAYVNVANPIVTPLIGGGNFYHGMIAFNFANSSIQWNEQLGFAPSSSEYDLYSVALHEIAHSMGFGSLISQNGQSKIGATFPYYSRYDTYLKAQNSIALVSQPSLTCSNSRYNWSWNSAVSPSVLEPGFTNTNSCIPDNTNCSSAINFSGSIVQPVYTPNCFVDGSTLSHFEDQCVPPTPGNNLYFAMANANNTGSLYMKRYFKPEERGALCDIGYSCGTSFGNPANLNNYAYSGSACPGAQVVGINDGINALGFYTFIGNVNTNIPITGILANDRFTNNTGNTFKCLEVINGSGTISSTSGTSSSFYPLIPGLHLLRYIPLDGATGKEGNITYVYVYAQSANCTANSCNIVNNGDFESGSGCGEMRWQLTPATIDCWENLSVMAQNYFVRNCFQPVPTSWNVPSTDTWNNGVSGNNAFVGLWNAGNNNNGAFQTQLSSSLLPNTSYDLSFWAMVANNANSVMTHQGGTTARTGYLVFAGGVAPLPIFNNIITSLPPSLTQLTAVQIPNNHKWNYFTIPITFTSNTQLSHLSVFNASWMVHTDSINFVLLDDISIIPTANTTTFTPPPPLCQSQSLNNLHNFISVTGGTFVGVGVTFNNTTGHYEFNSAANISSGTYPITYKYIKDGCTKTAIQSITVIGASASAIRPIICQGEAVKIQATGAITYSWNTGSTNTFIIVSPSVTSTYTLIGSASNSCSVMQLVTVSVQACTTLESWIENFDQIKIYPNPLNNVLNIETAISSQLEVFDLTGKIVLEVKLNAGQNTINTVDLPVGFYNLKAQGKAGNWHGRIVKVD